MCGVVNLLPCANFKWQLLAHFEQFECNCFKSRWMSRRIKASSCGGYMFWYWWWWLLLSWWLWWLGNCKRFQTWVVVPSIKLEEVKSETFPYRWLTKLYQQPQKPDASRYLWNNDRRDTRSSRCTPEIKYLEITWFEDQGLTWIAGGTQKSWSTRYKRV